MIASINRLLNRMRRLKKNWSAQKDQDFHDQLFAGQQHDPFAFSYFGYLTIKRFADLAAAYVANAKTVLDLGCGPAEITCELARRFPGISFIGVDHSPNAIVRAEANARALGLKNIQFQAVAMEAFQATQKFDLVLMFDSFHHLSEPRRFLERMGEWAAQFLLIEPRGDWKGSHVRDFDFDWIVSDLEKIRRRLAMKIGEPAAAAVLPGGSDKMAGSKAAALENRYTLEEFRRFFKGFGLKVRGTVSGLEAFPPDPFLHSPSREFFGKKTYEIFSELDELLVKNELDILAKHWVIFAGRDLKNDDMRIPRAKFAADHVESVRGPYDVEFLEYDGPRRAKGGSEFRAQVRFHNRGYRQLSSSSPENPDFLSYRWLDKQGALVPGEGLRTALVKPVMPDGICKAEMKILAPEKPEKYILAIDLVQEGKTWYSEAGNPSLQIRVAIKK